MFNCFDFRFSLKRDCVMLERVIGFPGLSQLSLRKCTLGHIDIAVGIIRNLKHLAPKMIPGDARNTGIVFPALRVVRKLVHILACQVSGSLLQTTLGNPWIGIWIMCL